MREIRIRKEESGQRLDKFLRRYLPGAGSGFLYKMLRKKNILLSGKKAVGKEILQEGDSIQIYFADDTVRRFQTGAEAQKTGTETMGVTDIPQLSPETILYYDDQLLIINKPAGLLTQKAGRTDVSLTEMVRSWLEKNGLRTAEDRFLYEPGPANRLDRNTSGLIVVPLTLAAAQQISEMFRERTICKEYLALAAGIFPGPERLKGWCMRDPVSRKTKILSHGERGADRVETYCEPLVTAHDRTLLKVTLITGKTHQIRSHLQACGFPVIGDPKYGAYMDGAQKHGNADICPAARSRLRRQFLHAWQLVFPQCEGPAGRVSGHVFTAPLPADLQAELDACGICLPNRK